MHGDMRTWLQRYRATVATALQGDREHSHAQVLQLREGGPLLWQLAVEADATQVSAAQEAGTTQCSTRNQQ
jgi:hypothetical protein